MIIKSTFKDYYDYVAHQYGGGDPNVVYPRERLVPLVPITSHNKYSAIKPLEVEMSHSLELENLIHHERFHFYDYEERKNFLYLVIVGKAYLLSRKTSTTLERSDLDSYKLETEQQAKLTFRYFTPFKEFKFGVEHPSLVELSRKISAPVFVIQDVGHKHDNKVSIGILPQCPILANLGIPSIISAQQMYQDIAIFVGNRMKDPPDTQPPVQLGNIQRILKAGFDLRQSFRHRK